MSLPFELGVFGPILQLFVAFLGAYLLAVWISLIVWTFRDIRARSRDLFAQLLSVILVLVFNVPGMLLYFLLRPHETLAENYERDLSEEALLQDIEDKQACPVCHQKIHSDFIYCPNCHTKLKRQCDHCHHVLNLRWTLCPYCGAGVAVAAAAPALPTTPAPAPMRAPAPAATIPPITSARKLAAPKTSAPAAPKTTAVPPPPPTGGPLP